MHLLAVNDIAVLSNTDISNCYNNCYMSLIIHSVFGTVIVKYITTLNNISSPVLKALMNSRKKLHLKCRKDLTKEK